MKSAKVKIQWMGEKKSILQENKLLTQINAD